MPEAAVDKHYDSLPRKGDVGSAGQFRVEAVATEAAKPEELAEDDFWLRVRRPNPGHIERSSGLVVDVHSGFIYEE